MVIALRVSGTYCARIEYTSGRILCGLLEYIVHSKNFIHLNRYYVHSGQIWCHVGRGSISEIYSSRVLAVVGKGVNVAGPVVNASVSRAKSAGPGIELWPVCASRQCDRAADGGCES